MTRDIINVHKPVIEKTDSAGIIAIQKSTVTAANGIEISKALANKNNTLFIVIENTGSADSTVTIKASDNYPNASIGDLTLPLGVGATALQLQDVSRFENRNGSIFLDFPTGFAGTIFALAKNTDLIPAF